MPSRYPWQKWKCLYQVSAGVSVDFRRVLAGSERGVGEKTPHWAGFVVLGSANGGNLEMGLIQGPLQQLVNPWGPAAVRMSPFDFLPGF